MSASATTSGFQATQRAFAAYIRHPNGSPLPPGVEAHRMRLYARLFYNNVESFLAETFRVLRQVLGADPWHALVRDFLRRHRAASPYFSQIPEEFLEYLGNSSDAERPPAPPFALELGHYEWVRLALKLAADADCAYDDIPLSANDALVLSPLAWPLRYAYPAHRIGPNHQPHAPPAKPTFLIAYRDRNDDVRFLNSNATTLRLLQLLGDEPSPSNCFQALAEETGKPADALARTGMAALNRLHERDIVLRQARAA